MRVLVNRYNILVAVAIAIASIPSTLCLADSKSVAVNVSVTIAPRLELSVSGPKGGNVEFGVVHKADAPVIAESSDVVLTVNSNLGKPYQITQALISPLMNEEGREMKNAEIRVQAKNLHSQGTAAADAALLTTPNVLFQSNPLGESDTIQANYRLKVLPDQLEGRYTTKLVYSILTL